MATPDMDLIIIGAGPAGLTAAQYGARSNLRVLVIEELAPGGQVLRIDMLENYPGIIPAKAGDEFAGDLHRQAEGFGAQFITESVLSLEKSGDLFTVNLGNGEKRSAYTAIVATGAKHRTLDVPGEKEFYGRGVSYCATCDGPFFRGKKIFVAGGGDAACDEAQYLARLTNRVVVVHRRDRFRAQKALAERTLGNPNIEVRFNTHIIEIKGDQKVSSVVLEKTSGETWEEDAGAVFVFAGTVPQAAFLPADITRDEGGYIVTDQTMASSLPGLFVAGDVRATPFRQVVVAAGEGAVAAHSAAAYIDSVKGDVYK
ncbi:thioredoxin reductase [Spirochaetia bacterium]|nr:thioredoxin reductase [Spirochaetia bacterium]